MFKILQSLQYFVQRSARGACTNNMNLKIRTL